MKRIYPVSSYFRIEDPTYCDIWFKIRDNRYSTEPRTEFPKEGKNRSPPRWRRGTSQLLKVRNARRTWYDSIVNLVSTEGAKPEKKVTWCLHGTSQFLKVRTREGHGAMRSWDIRYWRRKNARRNSYDVLVEHNQYWSILYWLRTWKLPLWGSLTDLTMLWRCMAPEVEIVGLVNRRRRIRKSQSYSKITT